MLFWAKWSRGSPQPEASIQVWDFRVCCHGPRPCQRPGQQSRNKSYVEGTRTRKHQKEKSRGHLAEPHSHIRLFLYMLRAVCALQLHPQGHRGHASCCSQSEFSSICLHHSLLSHPPSIPTAHRSFPLRIPENALDSGLWETAGHQGVGTMQ